MNISPTPPLAELLRIGKQAQTDAGQALRVALLGDTALPLLAGAIKGVAHLHGQPLTLFEGDFDQIDLQVFDRGSALHAFAPDVVIIYLAAERLSADWGKKSLAERSAYSTVFMERVGRLRDALARHGCRLIVFNLVDPGDGVFGHFGNNVQWTLRCQIRACNAALTEYSRAHSDVAVFDLAAIQAAKGRDVLFDPKLYVTAKFALTPDALPIVAADLLRVLRAQRGDSVKCVILDLDNTLWGGVIGDDGLDRIQLGDLGTGAAFGAFQGFMKQLRDRGIVLAICSKNDEETARSPFVRHPDMVLGLDDVAVFVANWKDKATNIRYIKSIIDVDYGAMMFLDDNPVERQLVRESFPTMLVPDLPTDESEYVSFLVGLNAFEVASYTAEDTQRTSDYQAEVERRADSEKYVNPGDFLRSLEMTATVSDFNEFNVPRVAQLTQRSNQFNLRTVRYSEREISDLAASPKHVCCTFALRDRFGDSGMVSVVILEKRGSDLFVDTWIMSCRVLGRELERFVLNRIVRIAGTAGCRRVVGEYLPTAKNALVKEHYPKLGFQSCSANLWVIDAADYSEFSVHIKDSAGCDMRKSAAA